MNHNEPWLFFSKNEMIAGESPGKALNEMFGSKKWMAIIFGLDENRAGEKEREMRERERERERNRETESERVMSFAG